MAIFPEQIDEFRQHTNLPGHSYDETKTDIVFAEDLNKIINSTVAIETALGVNFLNLWPINSTITVSGGDDVTPPFTFGSWLCIAQGELFGGELTFTWRRTA